MAMPALPFSPYNATDANNPYLPEDQIAQQYKLADVLRRQPQATSFAGVLANGLGAVGGNLVQGSANTALQNNQALRSHDIQSAAGATDVPSLSKALLGSQVPALQDMGLKTKIQQITDDPNKEYRVRASQAVQYGLKAGTPEFQQFVLTGKIKGLDVEAPSNVREWQYFNSLPDDQKPLYLTMKRADKYYDTGTSFVHPNSVNPAAPPVASIPKDVAGKAAQTQIGEAQGKAAVNLPIVENAADRMIQQIDLVKSEPGLSHVTGLIAGRTPNFTREARNAQSRIDQIKGGIFLQAYNDLRGAGQISNAEGESAKAAYARLNDQTLGTPEYAQALDEFKDQIIKLRDIARARAQGGNVVGAANGAPAAAPQLNGAPLPEGWSIQKVQ